MPAPDRPANEEIEVSPAMIEAGVQALENDRDIISDSGLVRAIYIAMRREE